MNLSTILSVLHEVAQTFLSIIQLFFAHIIPVFGIFIASLLSRIFCSVRSFVARPPKSRPSSSRNLVAPDLCDSPQEESDEDHEETPPPDDGFSSDDPTLPQFDDVRQNEPRRSLSTQEREEESEDEWQGSLSTQEKEIPDDVMVRDSSTSNEGPAVEPVVYPSDLPESLDYIERKPNADHLPSLQKRTLPPTLSMVRRTLRESSNKDAFEEESQVIAAAGALRRRTSKDGKTAKASRCQSAKAPSSSPTENVVAKFQKHFSMER